MPDKSIGCFEGSVNADSPGLLKIIAPLWGAVCSNEGIALCGDVFGSVFGRSSWDRKTWDRESRDRACQGGGSGEEVDELHVAYPCCKKDLARFLWRKGAGEERLNERVVVLDTTR